MSSLTLPEISNVFRYGFLSLAWGFLSPTAGRLSFIVFMFWVSGTDPMIKKWPIRALIISQVLVNAASLVVAYGQCGNHLYLLWTPTEAMNIPKYCWDVRVQADYNYFAGSFNSATDLFLSLLPAFVVWRTKMTNNSKVGLSFLLCLSIL